MVTGGISLKEIFNKLNVKLKKYVSVKKEHWELYDEASSEEEFEILREIFDRYGQNMTDRLDCVGGLNKEDAYKHYMLQVLALKNDKMVDNLYTTLGSVIIRETLLVEGIRCTQQLLDRILAFGARGEFFLEDVMYVIGCDKSFIKYFNTTLSYEELSKVFVVATSQLNDHTIKQLTSRYIWSTINV